MKDIPLSPYNASSLIFVLVYVCLYRYEKRHSNIPAHISPCFRVNEGDHVIIGQCRPLSKTVRFNVLKVLQLDQQEVGRRLLLLSEDEIASFCQEIVLQGFKY